MDKFINRRTAGKILAEKLKKYANQTDVMILALPRGGVPVAYEIAQALSVPLDIFIVRKLGVPGQDELAMGAIATGGFLVLNEDIIVSCNVSPDDIDAVKLLEDNELKRRQSLYRGNRPLPTVENKTVILVDDGIATGATMRVAIKAIRAQRPKKIVMAVPVAAAQTCAEMEPLVDEVCCPLQPLAFHAVGAWYDDFSQTTDEEVFALLNIKG
jgi:predicted phosphoribosyltransferase